MRCFLTPMLFSKYIANTFVIFVISQYIVINNEKQTVPPGSSEVEIIEICAIHLQIFLKSLYEKTHLKRRKNLVKTWMHAQWFEIQILFLLNTNLKMWLTNLLHKHNSIVTISRKGKPWLRSISSCSFFCVLFNFWKDCGMGFWSKELDFSSEKRFFQRAF